MSSIDLFILSSRSNVKCAQSFISSTCNKKIDGCKYLNTLSRVYSILLKLKKKKLNMQFSFSLYKINNS